MTVLTSITLGLLLFFYRQHYQVLASSAVFSEEHADAALEHTKMAIEHGKAGHGSVLVEHATEALVNAKKAAEVAKG